MIMPTVIVVILAALIIVRAVSPHAPRYSEFERKRRADSGEGAADTDRLRQQTYRDIVMWLGIKEIVLFTTLILLLVSSYGIGRAMLYGVVALFAYRLVAQLPFVRRPLQRFYDAHEPAVIGVARKIHPLARILYRQAPELSHAISSREELKHVIEQSSRFLGDAEKAIVNSGLTFADKLVRDHMTVRGVIKSVACDELLGPLVLDGLHKTGHSQFPVLGEDIDDIVGVVAIDSFLSVQNRQSLSVEDVMSAQVVYVAADDTLTRALGVMLDTKQTLAIVIDSEEKTVGLLSLSDILQEVFGSDLQSASRRSDHHDRALVASQHRS